MRPTGNLQYVIDKLAWMRQQHIWPNGERYLWTDAFGVALLVSLYVASENPLHLDEAEDVVESVEKVLGRERGLRIGEAADRDGQYFHYLTMWLHALALLGRFIGGYKTEAIALAKQIHEPFLVRGQGVLWKMQEDLSGPYPGYGFGALDPFGGYVAYSQVDPVALAGEIADMKQLIDLSAESLVIDQDLGLGMMLWFTHFFPQADWARVQRRRCINVFETMWQPQGYFCRQPGAPGVRFAFTNYGVSIGLQSIGAWPARVGQLHDYFDGWRSGDEYDDAAITHVMACSAHFPGLLAYDEIAAA